MSPRNTAPEVHSSNKSHYRMNRTVIFSQKFECRLAHDSWLYSSYRGALVFTSTMALLLKNVCDVPGRQAPAGWKQLSTLTSVLRQSNRPSQYARPRTRTVSPLLSPTPCMARHGLSVGRQWRSYATKPPGGGGSGFPGFNLGPQHQKGEALKEYVCP